MTAPEYAVKLPTEEETRYRILELRNYWRQRDEFIRKAREMINGKNLIRHPKRSQFPIRIQRTYMLTAAVSEKRARFLQRPEVAFITDSFDKDVVSDMEALEHAFNALMEEMDSNGDPNVWDHVVTDCTYLDEGWELIERAPAAFWPEITIQGGDGKTDLQRIFEDEKLFEKAKEEYKKQAGVPLRSTYVPLEDVLPAREGPTPVEVFHVEHRSLRSVLANPLFAKARGDLSQFPLGRDGGLGTDVVVLRYSNQWYYAYYALAPFRANDSLWPRMQKYQEHDIGRPILLHAYPHELGFVMYNDIPGRYGGWRLNTSSIEPVTRALLELNQAADTMMSQVLTNVGARYWPNLKWIINPEWRTESAGGTPKAPKLTDDGPIPLYIGEDLKPIFDPAPDPMTTWAYNEIGSQFNRIAGSPVVFGEREPGVNTGYHQSLQLTSAEHLDEKLEQNLAAGVRNRVKIIAGHIKAMDQTIWVAHPETHKRTRRQHVKWIKIEPKQLSPLPRVDVRVRKSKPLEFITALRAARDASADRRGPGTPMLSDQTIYEMILGLDEPDMEVKKIYIQTELQKLLDSGFLSQKIAEAMNMLEAQDMQPGIAEGVPVDPALAASIQGMLPASTGMGGMGPGVLNAIDGSTDAKNASRGESNPSGNQQSGDSGLRRNGGSPVGAPQHEQEAAGLVANAIRNGMMGGRIT